LKSDAERVAMYDAKTAPTTVSLKVASQLALMKAGFANKANAFILDDIAIQTILNADGTTPLYMYSLYYNFGREIRKTKNQGIDSLAMVANAKSLKVKYTSYGCTGSLLVSIALDVYAFVLP
jgi:hypothetical protein